MLKVAYTDYTPEGLVDGQFMTNSSRILIVEAEKYGVDWKTTPGTQVVTLSYKGQERSYYHQIPSTTTALAMYACDNKSITTNLLKEAEVSIPHGFKIKKGHDEQYINSVFDSLIKPIVVKPSDGTWGENITLDINTKEQYKKALDLALSYSIDEKSGAIVEEMFSGSEYRILATRDKVIGILERIPANVVGNGQDNIEKLIEIKNQDENRGETGSPKPLLLILIDDNLKNYLTQQGLELSTIPEDGKQVFLRKVSNISQGGDSIDITDKAHSSVKEIAVKSVRAIPGLSFAGVDFMTGDITKEQNKDSYIIIEINASPGFDMHDIPYEGENRHAAREFLFLLFPQLEQDLNNSNS